MSFRLDGISTTLLPFQKDAVNFMINKESYATVDRKELLRQVKLAITLPEDDDIQYFPCLGIFVRCSSDQIPFTDEVQGGILADEMGLGKTVELLALILSNTQDVQKTRSEGENKEESNDSAVCQSPTDKDVAATLEFLTSSVVAMADTGYLSPPKKRFRSAFPNTKTNRQDSVACSMCSVKYNMRENMDFDVSATLIIVPESLLHQWYEEIRRHCKDEVVVDFFFFFEKKLYSYYGRFDVVEELRKRPRGNIEKHPSPLLAVNFLRICLDESQLVESKVKAAAKMCSLLRARNHWCVSGTPLSKSVNGESHKRRKDLSCISDFRMFSPKLIFRKLFEDARTTIVQRHREMVANRNALAGIYMLLGDELGALNWYKQAYSIHEEQKELNRLLGLVEDVEENQDDFDAARMSYVIMLDSLVGTCAFKEFEEAMPFLRKPKRGKGWHEGLLARMYRVCRGDVMTAVHPFYELLLKWLTFIEKMIRIGREMTTFVQEWVNRERELVMGAMRFQFGMKISIPYLPRPLPLSADTLDIAIAIYDRTETVAAKALSSSLSALRYLNTLQRMPSHQNKVRCITCRQVFPIDATMYVVDKKDDLIPGVRLTVKFEQIIRHLKKLIEEDSTNKILVMPLRMGANGLNLTQANHVVFMEPITEMSVFAQAVGRIDRIGQRRAITVHNFVVKGSIEEEIYGIVNRGYEQSKWTLNTLRE
ncbi:protein, SNF2 family, partial [Ancylostoma duodenale]